MVLLVGEKFKSTFLSTLVPHSGKTLQDNEKIIF